MNFLRVRLRVLTISAGRDSVWWKEPVAPRQIRHGSLPRYRADHRYESLGAFAREPGDIRDDLLLDGAKDQCPSSGPRKLRSGLWLASGRAVTRRTNERDSSGAAKWQIVNIRCTPDCIMQIRRCSRNNPTLAGTRCNIPISSICVCSSIEKCCIRACNFFNLIVSYFTKRFAIF